MTHICVAWTVPSHYLNQCWTIVNVTLRNKVLWNINRNSYVFINENGFEKVVCEMSTTCLGPNVLIIRSLIARFMWPTWGPPGSCRPQVGPIWATWQLLSGMVRRPCEQARETMVVQYMSQIKRHNIMSTKQYACFMQFVSLRNTTTNSVLCWKLFQHA